MSKQSKVENQNSKISSPAQDSTLSPLAVIGLCVLALGLVLVNAAGPVWWLALLTAVTEGGILLAVLAAAGGYGHWALERLRPRSAAGGLHAVTSVAVGLWLLSTAVLVVGTLAPGSLIVWVWWPVIGLGVVLAGWATRDRLRGWALPQRVGPGALVWVLAAVAVGLWLSGALRPPGTVGLIPGDAYDVLEYHLQVPREFLVNGRIGELQHNVYSYYPLGQHMLFLLAMVLRGGAYEGMYLAKLLHGAYGVLAAAGVFYALRSDDSRRGRFAALLLATAPFAIYLSWLGMVELSEVCYLTLGLLWLREWLRDASWRSAAIVGAMLGAACSVKYLSVGFVVAPVLLVMLVAAVRRKGRGLAHVAVAGGLTLALFSPWLIRNAAYTGNPVFPLATHVLGAGHWDAESQQRWVAGHGPASLPPVPEPPGYEPPPRGASRLVQFYTKFLFPGSEMYGQMALFFFVIALAMLLAGARAEPWDRALVGVLIVQLLVWVFATHEMPQRFLVPAIVPLALMGGWVLSRLSHLQANPFRRHATLPPHGPWGRAPAVVLFVAAVLVNCLVTYRLFMEDTRGTKIPPLPGRLMAEQVEFLPYHHAAQLPANSRLLLVGDAQAFYFPENTVYATAFDAHPLAQLAREGLSGEQTAQRLKAMGITHLWVVWPEIGRLAMTYGFPAELSRELLVRRLEGASAPDLPVLRRLREAGMQVVREIYPPPPATQPAGQDVSATQPATPLAGQDAATPPPAGDGATPAARPTEEQGPRWPLITVYALP